MSPVLTDVTDALLARVLSTVATRLVKPPSIALTQRDVAGPETVMVPTRHGDVRCLVTRAAADAPLAAGGAVPPVHIHLHGGAFLVGGPRQDDHLVRRTAGEVGATVVNVDYSTGPDVRYPRAHEECYDVLRWVQRSGDTMGWDGARVSVGGISAGGNLALGTLELAGRGGDPRPRAGVLIVPASTRRSRPSSTRPPSRPPPEDLAARSWVRGWSASRSGTTSPTRRAAGRSWRPRCSATRSWRHSPRCW